MACCGDVHECNDPSRSRVSWGKDLVTSHSLSLEC